MEKLIAAIATIGQTQGPRLRALYGCMYYGMLRPPVLVTMLREHVQEHGTAPDGRLFQTYWGGIYLPSTLWHVLRKARRQVFTPAQLASPLVRRPYDFRHAGVSWRLNAGAPAPLVAEWAGHTVEVLLRIYAHCIDGDDERWFGAMENALGRG